jgi:hypothetical protein
MTEHLHTARVMRSRGIILGILKAEKSVTVNSPPMPVDVVVIRAILARFGIVKTPQELQREIAYLEERGYVRTEVHRLCGVSATLVELTAKGQDLMDGIVTDDTILFDD